MNDLSIPEPEPRLASVTAVEDTFLFRLDSGPLYTLMSSRVEVVQGVIQALIRRLKLLLAE